MICPNRFRRIPQPIPAITLLSFLAVLSQGILTAHVDAQSTWTTDIPVPQSYLLENGLEVVLAPHPRSQQVVVAVTYHVGRRDDPPGYEGLAHLLEHLTFRGSKHVADGDLARYVQSAGGEYTGMTFADHTVYAHTLPATELPLGLWLESERMAFTLTQFDEEKLEVEKKVVHAEWAERRGDYVDGRVPELIAHATYPESHPYYRARNLDEGTSDVSIDDVRWYYQRFYRPENARLVVAGHFDLEKAKSLIERYFAKVRPSGVATVRAQVPAVVFEGAQRLEIRIAQNQPGVALYFRLPCADVVCRTEATALAAYLTHGSRSPVRRALEDQSHAAVDCGASITETEREVSLRIWADARDDDHIEQVERVLHAVLHEVRVRGIQAERWADIRLMLATREFEAAQHLFGRVMTLSLAQQGGQPARTDDVLAALKDCSRERLSTFAAKVLRVDRRLLLVARPSRREKQGSVTDAQGDLRLRVLQGDRP